MGEDRCGDSTNRLRYFYEADGLTGFTYIAGIYRYVYDSQGNITMITNYRGNEVLAVYVYDAWGKCKVYDKYGRENNDSSFIGNVNPFRWKGCYYDAETGLYYVNGSYYDPDTGTYMNASPVVEALNGAYLTRSIDRNGLMCNNVLEFSAAQQESSNAFSPLSTITAKMLKALPSLPQWLAISTYAASSVLSLSVYARTALYMWRYPKIIDLMKLDGQVLLPGKYTKGVNIAAYGFVALDTILDIYTNIQRNKTAGYVIGSAVYTAATGAGIVWASGKIGALIAGSMTGPGGAIVGGLIGAGIGFLLSWLSNLIKGEIFK